MTESTPLSLSIAPFPLITSTVLAASLILLFAGCAANTMDDGGGGTAMCVDDADCPDGEACDPTTGECQPLCACDVPDEPVCGIDGRTYPNACEAACAGVSLRSTGACCDCAHSRDPVCTDDGRTFDNACEAECAGATIVPCLDPPPELVSRVTIRSDDSRPVTFETRTGGGAALVFGIGSALNLDGVPGEELVFVDGSQAWILDPAGRSFTGPFDFQREEDSSPLVPDHLVSGVLSRTEVVLATNSEGLWVLSTETAKFAGPLPLLEMTDPAMGTTRPFTPTSIDVVDLLGDGIGGIAALDATGRVFLMDPAFHFVEALDTFRLCSDGSAIVADHLVGARMPELGPRPGEAIIVVAGSDAYPVSASALCLETPFVLRDENDDPVVPDAIIAADTDGDDDDELIYLERGAD